MFVFDTNTMKAAACYQGDQQSCQDIGAAPSSSGGGSQFNIASYNVRHSSGYTPIPWQKRATITTDNIKANSMDIVGTQEMDQVQYNAFRKDLAGAGYDTYPKTYNSSKGSRNTIFYDSKFSFVAGETFVVPYYKDSDSSYPNHLSGEGASPAVELRDNSTGQTFWVVNTHLVAYYRNEAGGGGAIKREQGAKIVLAEVKKLSADGSTVFVTGDINSATIIRAGNRDTDIHGDRSRIPYCFLTKDGTLANTVDILKGRTGPCPDKSKSDIKIDQVYATPANVTVQSAKLLAGSMSQTGTDHAGPFVAAVTIGGAPTDASGASSTDAASATGWKWPIAQSDYTGLSECWNASYSGGHHAGQDIRAASGTNVYAAHDGTVTSYYYNSAGGNTLLVSAGNGLWYNYQHLKSSKVKKGDKVTAGQLVAISDNTGGNTTGPHLHFGIAVAPTTGSYANNSQTRDPLSYLPKDRKENGCN